MDPHLTHTPTACTLKLCKFGEFLDKKSDNYRPTLHKTLQTKDTDQYFPKLTRVTKFKTLFSSCQCGFCIHERAESTVVR